MASHPLTELSHNLVRALKRPDGADLSDAQLLSRFAEWGDADAFEALVRRHAPMVLGVCRRLLGSAQDVEDAVQVVFLVLAQKATSVRPRDAVAGWLYGVARKAALKARAAAARRKERPVAELPERPSPPAPGDDLRPLIERELGRLPEKYRAVVVLCDLEGRSRRDAARLLGWPEGTVCGRLARARALLARRLRRCGVTVSAATVTTLLAADSAPACVPAATLRILLRFASLHTASAVAVPAHMLALSREVQRPLWLGKIQVVVAVLAGAFVLGTGVGVTDRAILGSPSPAVQPHVTVEAAAIPAPVGVRTDAQRLPGIWQLVSSVSNGKKAAEDQVHDARLELTETAFRTEWVGPVFREAVYTIEANGDPRRLDFTSQGDFAPHTCRAIYRIEGDQLLLCYPRPGADRPARFESTPGSGLTLTLWKRVQN